MPNKEAAEIIPELESLSSNHPDAFLLYLFPPPNISFWRCRLGAAKIRDHKREDAFEPLLKSIQQCPYIWSTWQELSSIITDTETVCATISPSLLMIVGYNMAFSAPEQHHDKVLPQYREPGTRSTSIQCPRISWRSTKCFSKESTCQSSSCVDSLSCQRSVSPSSPALTG